MKGIHVHSRHFFYALVLSAGGWLLPLAAARADTVLYQSAGFIQGAQSFVQSFDITTPGTLTVTLSNIPWLDTIKDLTCFLTTSSAVLGHSMAPGTESIEVSPGMIYAHWFGTADDEYKIGVYGIKIEFRPDNVVPVPLPASWILLLSALGVLLLARKGHPRARRLPNIAGRC